MTRISCATIPRFCVPFDEYLSDKKTWAATEFPALQKSPIAYFSAEFGLHISIPIYSGGLGILAETIAKRPATRNPSRRHRLHVPAGLF